MDENQAEVNSESVAPNQQPEISDPRQQEPEKQAWYKNKLFMGVAAAFFVIIAGIGIFSLGSDSEPVAETPQANTQNERQLGLASALALTEGTVEFSTDGVQWTTAEGGETINVGDSVRTAASSRAIVLLDDGSAVRLDQNSEIKLLASDASTSEVALLAGQVYSRVVTSDSRTYAVITKDERFEALGTAFKTKTADDKDSLEVYQSKVMVESDETEVEEGNQYDTKDKEKSSIDLEKLKDDDFVQWNKDKDEKDEKFKDDLGVLEIKDEEAPAEPAPAPDPAAALNLSGSTADKGIALSWTNSGISASEGFKVVFSKADSTPLYKENDSQYVGAGSSNYTLGLEDGNTYYVRICAYRSSAGSCDSYSNTITVKAPLVEKEAVEPGDVILSIEGNAISWTINGTAPHGYKILLNSDGEPTYPGNSIKYVGAGDNNTTLPEKPAGTYFVRVCKYTADSNIEGGCTDYSNEAEYVVSE